MEILYLLIPIAMVLVVVIVWALVWSVKSGQFKAASLMTWRGRRIAS
jgi:cbb3-type cytochrome oxidase maturation protein